MTRIWSQDLHYGKREPSPQSCPLPSTWALCIHTINVTPLQKIYWADWVNWRHPWKLNLRGGNSEVLCLHSKGDVHGAVRSPAATVSAREIVLKPRWIQFFWLLLCYKIVWVPRAISRLMKQDLEGPRLKEAHLRTLTLHAGSHTKAGRALGVRTPTPRAGLGLAWEFWSTASNPVPSQVQKSLSLSRTGISWCLWCKCDVWWSVFSQWIANVLPLPTLIWNATWVIH